jgi:hypothetical protein
LAALFEPSIWILFADLGIVVFVDWRRNCLLWFRGSGWLYGGDLDSCGVGVGIGLLTW